MSEATEISLDENTDCTPATCPANLEARERCREGSRFMRLGNLGRARSALRAAYQLEPSNVTCALAYVEAGMFVGEGGLVDVADRLVATSADNPRAWLVRGLLEVHEQRAQAAERFLKRAAELEPRNPSIQAALAWQASEAGDLVRADAAWRELLGARQWRPEWHYKYGKFLHQSGRRDEARRHLEIAAKPRPLEKDAWQFWWTVRAGTVLHQSYGAPPGPSF